MLYMLDPNQECSKLFSTFNKPILIDIDIKNSKEIRVLRFPGISDGQAVFFRGLNMANQINLELTELIFVLDKTIGFGCRCSIIDWSAVFLHSSRPSRV